MYKISVPLMNDTVFPHNQEKYLQLVRRAGASRVFLAINDFSVPETLADNIAFFKQHGLEVGVWLSTIGHGMLLTHCAEGMDEPEFPPIVNIEGQTQLFANCPLDDKFRTMVAKSIAALAKCGPDIVMLDDDLRISQHGDHLCCACDEHLKLMSEILGEEITREQIKPYVLSGKANKYRDAWMQAQNESLIGFVQRIRDEVDKETPDVTLCNCFAYAPWNVDGIDFARIVRILAGNNQPILRLTGAPYWAIKARQYSMISVIEIARMLASFVENEGFDLMSEGDTYPRPRSICPAALLELYDAATRVDGGYSGILKYMFDYLADDDFETGYLQLHEENKPFYDRLPDLFQNGTNAGVRVVTRPHTMREADLDLSSLKLHSPLPADGTMLGSCSIPTIYRGQGICNAVFGENARLFDLEQLGEGTILDAVSAVILTERGVDVGLADTGKMVDYTVRYVYPANQRGHISFVTDATGRFLDAPTKAGAQVVLCSTVVTDEKPLAYRYENANGQRFLVFLFEGESLQTPTHLGMSGLFSSYPTQEILVDNIPWVARKPIPAYCVKNPSLYVMCEKDEGAMSVALFNCFADPVLQPTVQLDEAYSHIECVGCEAVLDGDKVTLTSKLHGYEFAAFRVSK